MKSFAQLLRLAFWMRPLQRALVILAALVAVLALMLPVGTGPAAAGIAPLLLLGMTLMLISPLFEGGLYLRSLSAQRVVQLLPHSRARLLCGTIGLVLIAALLVVVAHWIAQRPVPPQFRPGAGEYAMIFALTFTLGTQLAIGIFIGSRSPRWALVMVLALQLPGLAMRLAGVEDVPRIQMGPVGVALVAATWLAFGVWYMRTASISTSGWRGIRESLRSGGSRTLDRESGSQDEAMRRWLLGALTPMRATLVWLSSAALLAGVQLLFGRDSPQPVVTAMIFATVSLAGIGLFSIGYSIAQRSRGLWLVAGRDRASLHGWCERLLLQYVGHVALPTGLTGLILWQLLPARPAQPGIFVALSTLAMMLAMGWLGLAARARGIWLDMMLGVAVMCSWLYGLVLPLFGSTAEPRWNTLLLQSALFIAVRLLAAWRWRGADWPRAQAPDPAG